MTTFLPAGNRSSLPYASHKSVPKYHAMRNIQSRRNLISLAQHRNFTTQNEYNYRLIQFSLFIKSHRDIFNSIKSLFRNSRLWDERILSLWIFFFLFKLKSPAQNNSAGKKSAFALTLERTASNLFERNSFHLICCEISSMLLKL